jgi:V/A-type H+-transporting ATPase subunit G/H
MSQDSIDKIKDAENKAKGLIEEAKKRADQSILDEKNKWEEKVDFIKSDYDNKLKSALENAQARAKEIKESRQVEIKQKVTDLNNLGEGKLSSAADLIVDKFINHYK